MKTKIFATNIENFSKHYQLGLNLVSEKKREEISKFWFKEDRWRKLISALLLRYVVIKYLGIKDCCILLNKYGKPSLKNYPDFHFNISHSGNWVVIAIGDSSIGIDIEVIKQFRDFMEIGKNYFSKMEYDVLINSHSSKKLDLFYEIWTKKESLIKAEGKGLSISLKSFSVPLDTVSTLSYNDNIWNFYTPDFIDLNYKFSLCTTDTLFLNKKISYIDSNKLVLI